MDADDYRLRLTAKYAKGDVLDIGCANKPNPYLIGAIGADIIPFPEPDNYLSSFVITGENNYPEAYNGQFDTIIAGETLEHVDSPVAFLKGLLPLLAPSGIIIITTPNPASIQESLTHAWRYFFGHDYYFTPERGVCHLHGFLWTHFYALAARCGLEITTLRGISFSFSRFCFPCKAQPLSYQSLVIFKRVTQ